MDEKYETQSKYIDLIILLFVMHVEAHKALTRCSYYD